MADEPCEDHTGGVGTARPAPLGSRKHRIVVETPEAAAVDSLAERASRLGACTVDRRSDGTASLAVDYRETSGGRAQTSRLPRILDTVERWLRQQPFSDVTVWVDGRPFALEPRHARRRSVVADEPLTRERRRRQAARTASS
jgi:hypothetical protein